ncbi:MAG: hypothetical protein LBK00_02420 [Treponema sp.]|nr:hypothetical protein [Treponema sp.]
MNEILCFNYALSCLSLTRRRNFRLPQAGIDTNVSGTHVSDTKQAGVSKPHI